VKTAAKAFQPPAGRGDRDHAISSPMQEREPQCARRAAKHPAQQSDPMEGSRDPWSESGSQPTPPVEEEGFEPSVPAPSCGPMRRCRRGLSSTRFRNFYSQQFLFVAGTRSAWVGSIAPLADSRQPHLAGSLWREVYKASRSDQSAAYVPRRLVVLISHRRMGGSRERCRGPP
jgi:hypothetical protein